MLTKILAGAVAAVVVASVGLYSTYGGTCPFSGSGSCHEESSACALPTSEGSCCASKALASTCPVSTIGGCCEDGPETPAIAANSKTEAFAALGGSGMMCASK